MLRRQLPELRLRAGGARGESGRTVYSLGVMAAWPERLSDRRQTRVVAIRKTARADGMAARPELGITPSPTPRPCWPELRWPFAGWGWSRATARARQRTSVAGG